MRGHLRGPGQRWRDGGRRQLSARLSRRIFVRRAASAGLGLWLGPALACDGPEPAIRPARTDAGGGLDAATRWQDAAGRASVRALADASITGGVGRVATDACEPFLTPLPVFPQLFGGAGTVSGWELPALDASSYRLTIDGRVRRPLSLALDHLEREPVQVTVLKTIQCVFGPRGTAVFRGVPLRALLDRAQIDHTATKRVRFHGADGFFNNLRLADIYDRAPTDERFEPLVALRMHGWPLPREHGFPARLLLPDRYGFKNTKWLVRIEATESDEPVGQYQERGIAKDAGVIVPNSLYAGTYRQHVGVPGSVTLCGQALSGHGGIERVEISIDGGPFAITRLVGLGELLDAEPAMADALQVRQRRPFPFVGVAALWEHAWHATPGEHTVVLRVRDRGGEIGDGYRTTLVIDAAGG